MNSQKEQLDQNINFMDTLEPKRAYKSPEKRL